jgi:hypothetical protein
MLLSRRINLTLASDAMGFARAQPILRGNS